MAIKVDFATLQAKVSGLQSKIDTLMEIEKNANLAGDEAVSAAGGNGTAVGAAIAGSLQSVTAGQLSQIKTVIANMQEAIGKVANIYKTEEEDFVRAIQNLSAMGGSNSSSAMGTTGASVFATNSIK
jgi:hypothetical protein